MQLVDVKSDVFNIGSGGNVTINWLAKTMQKIANKQVGIIYAPERIGDVKHCKANSAKILEKMGYKATVQLEEGLTKYLEWYKENCI